MNWEDLRYHDNYEICSEFPHQIRKKETGRILKESIHQTGYLVVTLDGKTYYKHRIIAEQFIPNDEPGLKLQVDHINRNRTDNHINNLRWVSISENNLNRSSFKRCNDFVDELPEEAIEVDHYRNHDDISDLYFYDDIFYVYDRNRNNRYRIINKHQDRKGQDFIDVLLPNGLRLRISYNKFR